jgi:integrase
LGDRTGLDRGIARRDDRPPSPKIDRERVLTAPEIYEVWHACDRDRLGYPFGPLVKLLMLTGQRENEVASIRWPDLDLKAATWTLSSDQTKAGRAHIVPLSPVALSIIKAIPQTNSDFVFPATRERKKDGVARPVSGFSKVKRRLDLLCGAMVKVDGKLEPRWPRWVFHDLRRTVATELAKLRVPPHVTEKIINHGSSKVAGPMAKIYQRYDYLDERREALNLWASKLTEIVKPDKVARKRRTSKL